MTPAPEVSVIIPTRNRWHILSRSALPAALMQERISVEVIVVDDGSIDETAACLEALVDDRVRVIRNERSNGVSAARNRGIETARGAWLAFLDDDDIWAPRKLREQVDRATEANAGFAFSSAVTVDRDRHQTAYRVVPDGGDLGSLLFRGNAVPGGCSNVVARTDLVRQVGGFDEQLSMLADWDLWLRLALEAPGATCADVHVGYLQHEGNMAVSASSDVLRESRYLAGKHAMSGSERDLVDRLAPVRWVAWENFWAGHRVRAARLLLRAAIRERSWLDVSRGLRFLVWGIGPDWLTRGLWRIRHARDADARQQQAAPRRPDWLDVYDAIELPAVRDAAVPS
jgi:glycosyltransferase involved in cell wall biosynthesis